ncbi:hypothetical protein CEQ90_16210 [Lewinellaceae bacterium SD302]|nr:hypothetical protein CEQ90_16210 [Lewinellaceae bacterium SD302]
MQLWLVVNFHETAGIMPRLLNVNLRLFLRTKKLTEWNCVKTGINTDPFRVFGKTLFRLRALRIDYPLRDLVN